MNRYFHSVCRLSRRWLALLACLMLLPHVGAAAPTVPPLVVPDEPPSVPGAGLAVNLLLNFAVTYEDAGAAYREPYRAVQRYDGYFNPRLCYQYPTKGAAVNAAGVVPDLDDRSGYFAPIAPADDRHECRGAFSGNFLNWASTTTLDLLRLGLTGGDRVIDEPGLTVLQRAQLPDRALHPGFHSEDRFPRKIIPTGGEAGVPANVTPFGTDRLFIVSCGRQLLFSNTDQGKGCDGPRPGAGAGKEGKTGATPSFGQFNARVLVCTAEDAALRPALCVRYGAGYKPEGVLQAARQHVGVMGYLSELDGLGTGEYGGALRAPLKALWPDNGTGAMERKAAQERGEGQSGKDATAGGEWSVATGVLGANPDGADGGVSGAINYINRLGRGNDRHLGSYSHGDPGAELYYEALRYLQGRPASIAPGPDLDDGMPIWRTPADPVVLGCQRNVIATIGHAAFRNDRHVPGNTVVSKHDAARPADAFTPGVPFDVMGWTGLLGKLEAGATGNSLLSDLAARPTGPQGAGSYYLAGAAFWAHVNPIRSDKPTRVDSVALEVGVPAGPPESALYYAAKYGAFDDRNADGNPHTTSAGAGSEWAGEGGGPAHYHPAAGPGDIVPAVQALFGKVGARGGMVAGPSAVGTATDGAGQARYLIQTAYDAGSWTGSVQRRAVRIAADGATNIGEPAWDAAELLSGSGRAGAGAGPTPPAAERAIYTSIRHPNAPDQTVPFSWSALTPGVQAWFGSATAAGADDGLGQARIDYLRGERLHEPGRGGSGAFRQRQGILGDIVRSVPLIVGAPSASIGGPGYSAYRERNRTRRPVVFVGANDGMLHAFDAATGREQFAYVPNALLPSLAGLTDPRYQHRSYLDGSAAHADAMVRGRWASVLAAGMGMGARGLFALDVSNPAAFGDGMGALWEFTEHDDPAMGHIHAPPQIAKLNVGGEGSVPQYRYFVVTTGGINPAAGDGRGALFLLALDKPPEQKWQLGVNYYKLLTPAAENAPDAPNALSPATLAIGGDGAARHAYAGDLQGRLWRFDLAGKPPWRAAQPLFIARDASGSVQPIAHAPALAFAPGGGYLVMFGTGRFIERADADAGSFTPQTFYAVHDRLTRSDKQPDAPLGRAALEPRTATGNGPYRIQGKPLTYAGQEPKRGWYLDFPHATVDGERAAGTPVVRAGVLLFDTLLPGLDACSAPRYRSYVVDALSGLAFGQDGKAQDDGVTGELIVADGAPSSAAFTAPMLIEIATGSAPRHATGAATVTRRYAVVRPGGGAGAALGAQQISVTFSARRLSWRQVANWQDLHDKARR